MFNLFDVECTKKEVLKKALTHPSYTKDKGLGHIESYERLEFLGDAVLKLTMSKLLYNKYPKYEEGELSKMRSILVSDAILANIAVEIGIPERLILSKSEEATGGRTRPSNIACALEATLGAYYLDGKINEIEQFIKENILPQSDDIVEHFVKYNAKAVLQEYTQKQDNSIPVYTTLGVTGPQHKPVFEVSVTYNDKELARGSGHTKKEAQQNCAFKACVELGLTDEGSINE